MSDPPVLTEPMTVEEIAVFCGLNWRAAKTFIRNTGGVECGSQWQIPVARMPTAYHATRGLIMRMSVDPCGEMNGSGEEPAAGYKEDMEQLLNERDAAVSLRISLADLNFLIESGGIRYSVIASQVRFRPEDLRDAVRRLRVEPSNMKEPNGCQL